MQSKKITAAIGAVMQYIRTEEEAAAAIQVIPQPLPAAFGNLWGMSGRQTAMQMRMLLQMRAVRAVSSRMGGA